MIVLDWLIDPPRMRVTRRKALRWLIFPVVYFGYTLIRGAITGWYPYPFLNVAAKGYGQVLADGVGILIGMIAVGSATLLAGKAARASRGSDGVAAGLQPLQARSRSKTYASSTMRLPRRATLKTPAPRAERERQHEECEMCQ